jgi:hypothetical protein
MIPRNENCKAVKVKFAKACKQVTDRTNYEYRAMVTLDCSDHFHDKPFQIAFSV